MFKILSITQRFLLIILLVSCSKDTIEVPPFRFEKVSIGNCGNLVLYKIASSGKEALILELSEDNKDNAFFNTAGERNYNITHNGTNRVTHRTFDTQLTSNYFCKSVPPSSPKVIDEWFGNGHLKIINKIILDDVDGVKISDEDINKDGDPKNDDTDSDGYPNYIDIDDDGDHITTLAEDLNKDGDPTNDDTDKDGIPNYLDDDDDNDGVASVEESKTKDDDNDTIVDYLDPTTKKKITPSSPPTNSYRRIYRMNFSFVSLSFTNHFNNINHRDGYLFGIKEGYFTTSDKP